MINIDHNPHILQVYSNGMPREWLTLKKVISYYNNDKIMLELGNPIKTCNGGHNKINKKQSQIITNSIICVKDTSSYQYKNIMSTPTLTNEALFERDRYTCAYCGDILSKKHLSREHIHPTCQNGKNIWTNVVTACKYCNNKKGGRTLEQSNMSLLYLPYIPDRFEALILSRGANSILEDQMEFLIKKISKNSRFKSM